MQHLSLERDLEIVVIDGDRRFGNGHCLPAGPLREPKERLGRVDMVVSSGIAGKNEFLMQYLYEDLHSLDGQKIRSIESFRNSAVHVVSAIGNPVRFNSYLRSRDIKLIKHEFNDHHPFIESDLQFDDDLPIIMTEKDAVKCRNFNTYNMWYLPISVGFNEAFNFRLFNLLKGLFNG